MSQAWIYSKQTALKNSDLDFAPYTFGCVDMSDFVSNDNFLLEVLIFSFVGKPGR